MKVKLIKAQITQTNPYSGKTIKNSGIRKDLHSHVVGIERNGDRFLNPNSSKMIFANDIVWLVGDTHRVKACLQNTETIFRKYKA